MFRKILIVAIFFIPGLTNGQSDTLEKYLNIQHQRIGFNGTVLVTQNGKELCRVNVGKASNELGVPINDASVFKIASITKQFTAALIALAIEEKKVSLNDSLSKFFPELRKSGWRRINVHQLLTHTSGIPHNEGIKDYWTLKSFLTIEKEKALEEIFSMNLLFDPGKGFNYSSPGYFILSCIIESVYKLPFELILERKILKPLGLSHTGIYKTGKVIPSMVSPYHLISDSLIISPFRNFSLMKGSGDMYSTADALAKWNYSFYADSFWSRGLQKLLFTKHSSKTPHYGYGWYIRDNKRTVYYHGGGNFGCSALAAWYPDEAVSIVILSNVSVLPVNEIWSDVEKIIFNEPFQMPVIIRTFQLGKKELEALAGKYIHDDQELNIILANDRLYARLGHGMPFEIYAETHLTFYARKVAARFNFEIANSGNVKGVRTEVRNQTVYFKRIK
jgi:CubicO group peptidase (beta-lactamase class C family)